MKSEILSLLRRHTGNEYIALTSRCNVAIKAALQSVGKGIVLIPDQGGWLTYKKYPKQLGMDVVEVKTDYGLLDLDDLTEKIEGASCLLYSNPAGYFTHQDIKEIYGICKGKITVILDVSGCIGDTDLCNGDYADIIVGSFSKWKIADAGYGGFISSNADYGFESDFDETRVPLIIEKLQSTKERLAFLYEKCADIKKDLKDFDIIHSERKGVVVVVKFNNEKEYEQIADYCREKNLEYTECPRYIRVNEKAISIEVKRL